MSQRSDAIKQILQLLVPLVPGAGPYVAAAQAVWPEVRRIFVREGGDPADFDALMKETREGIAKLAEPDQFFGARRTPEDPSLPSSGAVYLKAFDPPIPSDADLILRGYSAGDRIAGNGESDAWMVVQKGRSLMGAKVIRTIGDES